MKRKTFNRSIVVLLILFSCSFITNARNYQIECVSVQSEGYVTVKIWDLKKGKSYTYQQAQKDAVKSILKSGIPGINRCSMQPPLLSNSEEQKKFKKIEKKFFSNNGKWMDFTRSSTSVTSLPEIVGEKRWAVYQVSVSREALRKYLVEQNIIQALNSKF
jgi:hypothetical protein